MNVQPASNTKSKRAIHDNRLNKSTTIANISGDRQINYLFITPAVSIDHTFDNSNMSICVDDNINFNTQSAVHHNNNNNNNIYSQPEKQPVIFPNRRANVMPKRSWRWCALICSAVRCFGNSAGFSAAAAYTNSTYTDHVLDLIVSNEAHAKAQNIPCDL